MFSALRRLRHKAHHQLEANIGYRGSLRTAWAIDTHEDPVCKKTPRNQIRYLEENP